MGEIQKIEPLLELWVKATPTMRKFLLSLRLYDNDHQTCKAIGINPSNPAQWRARYPWFKDLEYEFKVQPIKTIMMFFQEMYAKALLVLDKSMGDDTASWTSKIEAAKTVIRHYMEIAEHLNRKEEEFKLRFKDDDGRGDRTALQPTLGTEISPPESCQD